MKKQIAEESILLVSVIKWFFLAGVIGALVGLSTSFFILTLNWATGLSAGWPYYFLLLPGAMFLSALATKYLAPEAEGHGTEKVIEAVHRRAARIKARVVPVKLVTTIVTLAAGGSAGKEGPAAQIGGGLAAVFATMFRFDRKDRKKFVICGISAGFASVFGTPIAGAIFGIEVLFVGGILYDVLLPSFIAGVISYQVSSGVGVSYFYHPMDFVPAFSESFFIKVVLAGVLFGVVSRLLIESLYYFQRLARRIRLWEPARGLIGGAALVVLALIFSDKYLGLGLDAIEDCLQGVPAGWLDFALKILFTCITLSFGGSGGMVTPIFFIGVTSGSLLGQITGLDLATFSAIGMVALLAGSANTPIAASILSVEMFGPTIAPYAAVACVVSFLMTGHQSVYPSQVLAIKKSSSLKVELGKEVESTQAELLLRRRSLLGALSLVGRKLMDRLRQFR